ncbi:MAG: FG-GAP-like repeat-containing protein, partial [Cytophagaceae bacterium]|nr:FG-GAP-like repeat-containing protein [Cytophagaceae bacterium]
NPFTGVDVGVLSSPSLGDVDGDGDLDAVVGELDGNLNYFKNTGTATAPLFVAQTGSANPFNGVDVGFYSRPSLGDVDGDGDLDALVGENDGTLNYFKNTGTATAPLFVEQTGSNNPFNGVNVGSHSTLSLGDVDGDGDLDALVGEFDGNLNYFENTILPLITQQPTPSSQAVCVGGSASSTLTATGVGTLTYAWYRNQPDTDEPVSGQTTATLSLSTLQLSDAGSYFARVTGQGGSVWSEAFVLTVNSLPVVSLAGLAPSYCQYALPTTPGTPAGGTYVIDGGPAQSNFNPATLAVGSRVVVYAYTDPSTTCSNSVTQPVSIQALAFTGTPTVSGVPVCAGGTFTVSFSTRDCGASSLFRVELSNASGSFANATNLGSFPSGGSSVSIPGNVPAGSGYRIRVVSGSGGPVSNPSGAFRIRACNTRLAAEVEPGLQVGVSPNPTEGLLRINIQGAVGQALRVELFNGAGQVIRQQGVETAIAKESLSWDISHQPAGLYLLRVSTPTEARTVKVLR